MHTKSTKLNGDTSRSTQLEPLTSSAPSPMVAKQDAATRSIEDFQSVPSDKNPVAASDELISATDNHQARREKIIDWLDTSAGRKSVMYALSHSSPHSTIPAVDFDDIPIGTIVIDEGVNVVEKISDSEVIVLMRPEHDSPLGAVVRSGPSLSINGGSVQVVPLPDEFRLTNQLNSRFVDLPVGTIFFNIEGSLWEKTNEKYAKVLEPHEGGLHYDREGAAAYFSDYEMVDIVAVPALRSVYAHEWWTDQCAAARKWAKSDTELKLDIAQLGEKPANDLVHWFNTSGNQCKEPDCVIGEGNKIGINHETFWVDYADRFMTKEQIEHLGENFNDYANLTTTERKTRESEPTLVLRGVRKLDNGEFDTTLMLFNTKNDYMQGFVKVGDVKHQVIAHIIPRKPDQATEESRSNFIRLLEPIVAEEHITWKEIGFGNAINRRKDDKAIFFDEMLFSIGDDLVKARIAQRVDNDLHRQIGFKEPRKERPGCDNSALTSRLDLNDKPSNLAEYRSDYSDFANVSPSSDHESTTKRTIKRARL